MIQKVNLKKAFASFQEAWSPRIAGEVNDMQIKLTKLDGEFIWHTHSNEDEMFLVTSGRLRIQLRDRDDIILEEGEFVVIGHGVEHRPIAEGLCEVVLFEPKSTLNTGDVENDRTLHDLPRI